MSHKFVLMFCAITVVSRAIVCMGGNNDYTTEQEETDYALAVQLYTTELEKLRNELETTKEQLAFLCEAYRTETDAENREIARKAIERAEKELQELRETIAFSNQRCWD